MIYANVDRTGIIQFEEESGKDGALPIGKHESAEILEAAVSAISRHAYDGKTYIVAGVRDVENDDEALDALFDFESRLEDAIIDAEEDAAEEVAA